MQERDVEPILGLIGTSPSGHPGPLGSRSFADFQRVLGEIEAVRVGAYRAGHAACHALMNDVEKVVFSGVDDLTDLRGVVEAFERLVRFEPQVSALVAPGVIEAAPALVEAHRDWAAEAVASSEDPPVLWLDAPDGAPIAEVVERQRRLDREARLTRLVVPWVATVTPGRGSSERLPGSCLVAPLHLGTVSALRGVHTLDRRLELAERKALEDAGCGLLAVKAGRRRQVHLVFPAPLRDPDAPPPPQSLESQIEEELERACEPLLDAASPGPTLWMLMVRNARAVLERFRRAGEITDFRVRCDDETNMDVVDGVALEVVIRVPQRVRQFKLRLSRF